MMSLCKSQEVKYKTEHKVEIVKYGTVSVRCPASKRFFPLVDLYGSHGCVNCKYHSRIGLQRIYCFWEER